MIGESEFGTVSYNDYAFRGAFHATIDDQFVYDDSGRVVMYVKHRLVVRAIIVTDDAGEDQTTDTAMATIRDKLSRAGKRLIFAQKGFGLSIDTEANGKGDVIFGPKPQVISWIPIGSSNACQVTWQCEFHLSECQPAAIGGILGVSYEISAEVNHDGITTRTISGSIHMSNGWAKDKTLAASPDYVIQRAIRANPIRNFRRNVSRHISADKTRVGFTITDTEINSPTPFPLMIREIDGRHAASWNRAAPAKFHNSLSLSMTVDPRKSLYHAWLVARDILKRRTANALSASSHDKKAKALIDSVEISEGLFSSGRSISFHFTWRIIGCIHEFIKDSGLFVSCVDDEHTWAKWQYSIGFGDDFGSADWKLEKTDDKAVDLCAGKQQSSAALIEINNDTWLRREDAGESIGIANEYPDPQYSYLKFRSKTRYLARAPYAVHQVLQDPEQSISGETSLYSKVAPYFGAYGGIDTIIQLASRRKHFVLFYGEAERAGYPIPKPKLEEYGGQKTTEVDVHFEHGYKMNALGVPIYSAKWGILYSIPNTPTSEHPPEHYGQCIPQSGDAHKPDDANK